MAIKHTVTIRCILCTCTATGKSDRYDEAVKIANDGISRHMSRVHKIQVVNVPQKSPWKIDGSQLN